MHVLRNLRVFRPWFVVNVQSVSVQQYIIQYIQNTVYKQFSCGLYDRLYKRKSAVMIHFKKCSVEHGVTGVVL